MKNTHEGDVNLNTLKKELYWPTKNHQQYTIGQVGFIYKSSRDYHIKCGCLSLVIDIHMSMIMS